jgi:hypothetical protein
LLGWIGHLQNQHNNCHDYRHHHKPRIVQYCVSWAKRVPDLK